MNKLGKFKYVAAVVIPIVVIVFPLGYSVVAGIFTQSAESAEPFLERPDPKYEN